MSARGTMRHRATVERNMAEGTDAGGQPVPADWQPHLTGLPCRAWYDTRRETRHDENKDVLVEERRMIVPRDTDITERDRIAVVTNRKGDVIFTGPAAIEAVGRRRDHLVLTLEEVS